MSELDFDVFTHFNDPGVLTGVLMEVQEYFKLLRNKEIKRRISLA